MVAWKHHGGEVSQTVAFVSGFVSLLVFNSVIITAIHFREKRKNEGAPRGFVFGSVGLALSSALLTVIGVYSIPEHNDYVELAFSNVPLDQIHPERKALVVELLRRTAAHSKKYESVAAQMKPISPQLYSADSFATVDLTHSVTEQYKKAAADDSTYRETQLRAMNEFRNKMMAVDPDYLKSFEAGQQEREMRESKYFQKHQESVNGTLTLYEYAEAHSGDISVRDGQLRFANDGVRIEFARQLEVSKSLNEQCQEALQEFVKNQQRLRKNFGLGLNSWQTPIPETDFRLFKRTLQRTAGQIPRVLI
jgi:hypothetical protein